VLCIGETTRQWCHLARVGRDCDDRLTRRHCLGAQRWPEAPAYSSVDVEHGLGLQGLATDALIGCLAYTWAQ
jgi:hypothetical protein